MQRYEKGGTISRVQLLTFPEESVPLLLLLQALLRVNVGLPPGLLHLLLGLLGSKCYLLNDLSQVSCN